MSQPGLHSKRTGISVRGASVVGPGSMARPSFSSGVLTEEFDYLPSNV